MRVTMVSLLLFACAPAVYVEPQSDDASIPDLGVEHQADAASPDATLADSGSDRARLTVTLEGTGHGVVTSSPAAILCGDMCEVELPLGARIELFAAPSEDSELDGWSDAACGRDVACSIVLDETRTISARFALKQFVLQITKSGDGAGSVTAQGIDCGSDCSESFAAGAVVMLTAQPELGSTFGGWSGPCAGLQTSCSVTMDAMRSVGVAFDRNLASVSVSSLGTGAGTITSDDGGILCPGMCSHSYQIGASVRLVALPDSTSTFDGWSGNAQCSGVDPCTLMVPSAQSVSAQFTRITYPLTVATTGGGGGTVSSDPVGIVCGGDCAESFVTGELVTLRAVPDQTSVFAEWTGDCQGSSTSCTIDMIGARSASARFELRTELVTISLSGAGGGTVSSSDGFISCPGTSCSHAYPIGAPVILTASPNASSTFGGWTGAGCPASGGCSFNVSAPVTIDARFDEVRLTVSKMGAGDGLVTSAPAGINCGATCSAVFSRNAVVTLTAAADGFSRFDHWSGACMGSGACNVTMSAASAVTAHFELPNVPVTNGHAADLVLGQPDFTTDNAVVESASTFTGTGHCDSDGTRLWIADGFGRALQWNGAPLFNMTAADRVVGQANATSHVYQTTRREMREGVTGVSVYNGIVYFSDTGSNRVIGWTVSNNPVRDAVVYYGQASWTDGVYCAGRWCTRIPRGIWMGAAGMFVAEQMNLRVSIWSPIPAMSGEIDADVILTGVPLDARRVEEALDVHYDAATDLLFVVSGVDNRVLAWNGIPTSDMQPADFVLGQSGFGSRMPNAGAPTVNDVGFSFPVAVHTAANSLFVVDQGNHRVMVWTPIPQTTGTPATAVLGQPDFVSQVSVQGSPTQTSTRDPSGVCHLGNKLFVVMYGRALRFDLAP